MLKKAGIVVAAAAAGLLAVSPLAFAGDKGHDVKGYDGHDGGDTAVNSVDDDSTNVGLVNVADNEVNVPIQACNNNVPIVNLVPVSDVTGIVSLLDLGDGDNSVKTDESCDQSNSSGGTIVQNIG